MPVILECRRAGHGDKTTDCPPIWVIATWKDTRVRVDGRSKINANTLPLQLTSSNSGARDFMDLAASNIARKLLESRTSRLRKWDPLFIR